MSSERLQKLRELNDARTKGPWRVEQSGYLVRTVRDNYDDTERFIETIHEGDAPFLVELANNADWLIGCVEALDAIMADISRTVDLSFSRGDTKHAQDTAISTIVSGNTLDKARAALAAKGT